MVHLIISLNATGMRKVDNLISFLKTKGLTWVGTRQKITFPKVRESLDVGELILQHRFNELNAMDFYKVSFSPEVLKRKLAHFFGNNLELFFDNDGDKKINPNELWEEIVENVYKGHKLPIPIIFVLTDNDENGECKPFIPEF